MALKKQTETWLITGGLGYIGAHVAREFIAGGSRVVILDNLSSGLVERLAPSAEFIEGDVRNSALIREVCAKFTVTGIVHMAAFKHARESNREPSKYYSNNIGGTLGLVDGILGTEVRKVILSSSCSIYGSSTAVDVNSDPNPQSPYAVSKLYSEKILMDSLENTGIVFTSLRFFNVIGCADFPGAHDQSTECLVPVITEKIRQNEIVEIFGTELDTLDGTCLRDYLDVRDIASAHALIGEKMNLPNFPHIFNLSSGEPVSVKQIITQFSLILNHEVKILNRPPNPADPVAIWANQSTYLKELGWSPRYTYEDSIRDHVRSTSLALL